MCDICYRAGEDRRTSESSQEESEGERKEKYRSKAEEEIETFEKLFLFPLETSFDDSGYDPGSVADEMESREFSNDEDCTKEEEINVESDQKFNNSNSKNSKQENSVAFSKVNVSSPPLSTTTESDCDSGAFSRSSTPATNIVDKSKTLESPSLVLAVVKEGATDHDVGGENSSDLKTNTNLLLSCLNEAGKSSSFSTLDSIPNFSRPTNLKNSSNVYEKARVFKHNPKTTARPHPTYKRTLKEANLDHYTRGFGGSLGELYWKRREKETWASETDIRFSYSRILQQQQQQQQESHDEWRYKRRQEWRKRTDRVDKCMKGCITQVTVNGQHICSFS